MKKMILSILLLGFVFCMQAMKEKDAIENSNDALWTMHINSSSLGDSYSEEKRVEDIPAINASVCILQKSTESKKKEKTTKQKREKLQKFLQGSVDIFHKESSNPADGPALIIDYFKIDEDYFKRKVRTSVTQFIADLSGNQVAEYYADYKEKKRRPVGIKTDSFNASGLADEDWLRLEAEAQEVKDLVSAGIGYDVKD